TRKTDLGVLSVLGGSGHGMVNSDRSPRVGPAQRVVRHPAQAQTPVDAITLRSGSSNTGTSPASCGPH
ncbi:MAG TPA: hypothetical protein VK137_02010, partial [Planctomycetaceae bacterium]|nr:hypothetical protein [Planctomycetaceae bacterium]